VRILHVITTLDVGGAEMHVLAQVRGQAARGHAVRVLWLKGGGSLAQELRDAGAAWVSRAGPGLLLRSMRRADIVHSHLLKADALCALLSLAARRSRRLVSSKHNDERALLRPAFALAHRLLARVPARTIVLSDHVGRFFAEHGGVDAASQRRIYYGLDAAPFEAAAPVPRAALGLEADQVVLVCVARFAPQKAHDVLLRAFARALEVRPDLRLLLVGDDPFGAGRERAETLARGLGLGERVVFAGIRRDLPALLGACDVFVLASLWEGLGLVFLEAMAAGLPVLATRVSAVPEVVVDGGTGRLVPPSDAEALARGMLELAGDPALRARLGAAGRARVRERFALPRMIDETLEVYGEVAGAAGVADGR